MIYLDSRYATGTLFKAWDARKSQYNLTVYRNFPTYKENFFYYSWAVGDRFDLLAHKFLGSSELWWTITDINAEILNPNTIAPGTQIRIPNA